MRRPLILILLFKLSLELLDADPLFGTAIIVVRTTDHIIAAADSKAIVDRYPDWKPVETTTCKLQKLDDSVYFATAGFQFDATGTFDLAMAIRKFHKTSASVSQTVAASEPFIKSSFREALTRQKREHAENFQKNFSRYSVVDFVLFGIDHGSTVVYTRRLRAQDDFLGLSVTVYPENLSAPLREPRQITMIGEFAALKAYVKGPGSFTRLTDIEIAKNAVSAAISNTQTAGPPIDILRLDRQGPSWIEVKNECR
jgi:hypothetical protein